MCRFLGHAAGYLGTPVPTEGQPLANGRLWEQLGICDLGTIMAHCDNYDLDAPSLPCRSAQ